MVLPFQSYMTHEELEDYILTEERVLQQLPRSAPPDGVEDTLPKPRSSSWSFFRPTYMDSSYNGLAFGMVDGSRQASLTIPVMDSFSIGQARQINTSTTASVLVGVNLYEAAQSLPNLVNKSEITLRVDHIQPASGRHLSLDIDSGSVRAGFFGRMHLPALFGSQTVYGGGSIVAAACASQHRLVPDSLQLQLYYRPQLDAGIFPKLSNSVISGKFRSNAFGFAVHKDPLSGPTGQMDPQSHGQAILTYLYQVDKDRFGGVGVAADVFLKQGPSNRLPLQNLRVSAGGQWQLRDLLGADSDSYVSMEISKRQYQNVTISALVVRDQKIRDVFLRTYLQAAVVAGSTTPLLGAGIGFGFREPDRK